MKTLIAFLLILVVLDVAVHHVVCQRPAGVRKGKRTLEVKLLETLFQIDRNTIFIANIACNTHQPMRKMLIEH